LAGRLDGGEAAPFLVLRRVSNRWPKVTIMSVRHRSSEVGIIAYPGAQAAAVHGLTDLFAIAGRFAAQMGVDDGPGLRVSHWSPAAGEMLCVWRSDPASPSTPSILIVPPTLGELPDAAICASIGRWLLARHEAGANLVTVCSGVFLVAATGLLDGRVVATHRLCARALEETFPQVAVDTARPMIEHGDILTAGGFMAWVDVALLIAGRLFGEAVRAETARFVLQGDDRAADAGLAGLAPRRDHADEAVRRAQQLVHLHDGRDVSLAAMAAAARLERRTFLRRFAIATGMAPMEYCRAVRMARAREILEAGNQPLKRIAEMLGYVDVSTFARAFRRSCGVAPGTYRSRHGGAVVAAPPEPDPADRLLSPSA
jgi:transcriptional regulator GlxA family with amidase domain